jgi:hypothetical protein
VEENSRPGNPETEWDEDLDNGFRPPGIVHLSETTVNDVPYVQDWGSVFQSGTATHHLTLYRAASGSLVFSAGTVQWAWGLDGHHDHSMGVKRELEARYDIRIGRDPRAPDQRVEQAMVNLFADMGVQPANLEAHLSPAKPSDDNQAPVSRIEHPSAGPVCSGAAVTVAGVASDRGGGVVGGVEVSVDGGETWHPARGCESWTFDWVPEIGAADATIMSRATDDSGNIESPGPGLPDEIRTALE